jgi:phospholipase C
VHLYGGEFTAPLQLDVQREHLERIVLAGTAYHLVVSGPNGFAREFIGARGETVSVSSEVSGSDERLDLELSNTGSTPVTFVVGANVYAGGAERRITVRGRSARSFSVPVHKTQGWYDVTITIADVPDFRRHLAGHVETGRASISG